MQKPSVPKGTRDFSPAEMMRRNYIFDTIRSVFMLYGYQPIETPAMENLSTLLGKYGEEGDRLIFKILNSGDYLANAPEKDLADKNSSALVKSISEKALRYDLTVPFARYVVMHQNEITFPFKRYQLQPVWRADRPQKGRYREFTQCDVDVIGSDSLMYEKELMQLSADIFRKLNVAVIIKVNNRKILLGIAESLGIADKFIDFTIVLDKIQKVTADEMLTELVQKGFAKEKAAHVMDVVGKISVLKSNNEKLGFIKAFCKDSPIGLKGIYELETILEDPNIIFDLTLARGLNYYTGAIFEIVPDTRVYPDLKIGSISGGGRYDDLTGIFGLPNVSGVGISFGADRIYDVMMEQGLFPQKSLSATQLLFVNMGVEEQNAALKYAVQCRNEGIRTEVYPNAAKMKKQFDYANSNHIPFVAIVGADELKSGTVAVKDMLSGVQETMQINELLKKIISLS